MAKRNELPKCECGDPAIIQIKGRYLCLDCAADKYKGKIRWDKLDWNGGKL